MKGITEELKIFNRDRVKEESSVFSSIRSFSNQTGNENEDKRGRTIRRGQLMKVIKESLLSGSNEELF